MKMTYILAPLLLLFSLSLSAQRGPQDHSNSVKIYKDLLELQVVGRALYIAAHPDDENTRLISYLSNHLHLHTTYLSLTRGDGGQNLIGTEIQEELGVLRTQELLAARRVDGGHQRFSRANDFGYSKNPVETLEIWDKDVVLGDVVWAIRQLKPDIIINRFSHDSGRKTHGHHTTSAMLSVEAFDMSADRQAYPEQLQYTEPWQADRLFFNTSWWFYGSRDKFQEADKSQMVSVDIGSYDPLTGLSNNEIAAHSRSQHRCQGFGRALERGSQQEYCQFVKGNMPQDREDLLDGLNLTWSRVPEGESTAALMQKVIEDYDFSDPAASIPSLLALHESISGLPPNPWSESKLRDLEDIILKATGLYQEAVVSVPYATRGESIELTLEFLQRAADSSLQVEKIALASLGVDTLLATPLVRNEILLVELKAELPLDLQGRSPYWLREPSTLGMYTVSDPLQVGLPENPPVLSALITYRIGDLQLTSTIPVEYAETDPAVGESYYPFDVLPLVTSETGREVYIFADGATKSIEWTVHAHKANLDGVVRPVLPTGWMVQPSEVPFQMRQKGEQQTYQFEVTPPESPSIGDLSLQVEIEDKIYDQSLRYIDYEHIPRQIILSPAQTRLVHMDVKKRGERVGYVMGAGDKIPENLEQIGYEVQLLEQKDIQPESLRYLDAVIMGIRALNTLDWLPYVQDDLMEYVRQGGTLIHQYNTSFRLKTEDFSPYPLQLSRDRVTREDAEVRILAPDHPVMNFPNKITSADFDGWVQERGLYFPDEWSEEFVAILSSNDPGESPKDGGLLVAQYGDGHFVYTGYSWFRELPAGVPGAFRIFANLLSLRAEP